jgi:hypothetical protein
MEFLLRYMPASSVAMSISFHSGPGVKNGRGKIPGNKIQLREISVSVPAALAA